MAYLGARLGGCPGSAIATAAFLIGLTLRINPAWIVLVAGIISLLAFGGGQAALPLVEQVAVRDMHWVSASTFGAAVAFSYVTPGPVLIVAAFIGFQVAGMAGVVAATLGAFVAPWALAPLRPARSGGLRPIRSCATSAPVPLPQSLGCWA